MAAFDVSPVTSCSSLINLALPPFLHPVGIAFSLIAVLRAGAHFRSSFL
ncbi:hypothetical protein [Dentiradicibacter hellwigii]|uniref:Uncharacterized protein n=1 Tax=Dentiradicibacter hellwigii TaxID=3149053 RepID=A0ABV4UEY2_9RHOO